MSATIETNLFSSRLLLVKEVVPYGGGGGSVVGHWCDSVPCVEYVMCCCVLCVLSVVYMFVL